MLNNLRRSFSGSQLLDNYKKLDEKDDDIIEGTENLDPEAQENLINQLFSPTTSVFPIGPEVQDMLKFKLGFIINPIIKENPPLFNLSMHTPIKCSSCHAILNPYCTVNNATAQWICNICGNVNKGQARGIKLKERPEYKTKVFDFIAPPSYKYMADAGPSYLFAIDTSAEAVQSGLTMKAADYIREMLNTLGNKDYVTLITFDKIIRIHEINEESTITINPENLQSITATHAKLETVRIQLNNILTKISQIQPDAAPNGHCLGSVLEIAPDVLKGIGGILLLFCHGRPKNGPRAILERPEEELDRPYMMLRIHEENIFYREIGNRLIQGCISYHLFSTTFSLKEPVDFGTVAIPCGLTGGRAHFYLPGKLDMMKADIEETIKSHKMWNALASFNLPNAAKIKMFHGNVTRAGSQTVSHPVVLEEDSIAASVKIESNIEKVPIQISIVYTDDMSRRIVRLINTIIPTSPNSEIVVSSRNNDVSKTLRVKVDVDTILANPAKKVTTQALRKAMHDSNSTDELMALLLEVRRMSSAALTKKLDLESSLPPAIPTKTIHIEQPTITRMNDLPKPNTGRTTLSLFGSRARSQPKFDRDLLIQ